MTRRECSRIRQAFIDLAAPDAPLPWPLSPDVQQHLDRCGPCRTEAERLTVTSYALRRLATEAATIEPEPDRRPWRRERQRGHRRPWVSAEIGGGIMAMSIVVLFAVGSVLPGDLGRGRPTIDLPAAPTRLVDRTYDPPARVRPPAIGLPSDTPPGAVTEFRLRHVALDRSAPDPVATAPSAPVDGGLTTPDVPI